MFANRKTGYKLPPTTIRDKLVSQESRRIKALEEQKRRRAQKVDSSRQLDAFAGLNLGGTDDEDDPEDEDSAAVPPASVAKYASMLTQTEAHENMPNTISSFEKVNAHGISFAETPLREELGSKKKSKKRKSKRRTDKPTKWADKCMYAELLEMVSDDMWSQGTLTGEEQDCLPKDLETAWMALAPVPAGKRCLAVTHQSAGIAGVVPNTTLRSRLLGKILIQRFPSPLPPLTILDCILDANWRDNGILHIIDVVKWKGQDVGDCEARFRFWWRDTRLAELTQMLPPTTAHSRSHFVSIQSQNQVGQHTHLKYRFPYPTTFIPVPCHTNTTLIALDKVVIPASRTIRQVDVIVPSPPEVTSEGNASMDVEPMSTVNPEGLQESHIYSPALSSFANSSAVPVPLQLPKSKTFRASILSDGLLLYVAEASYEPGTSPLSSWVPISAHEQKTYTNDHMGEPENGATRESPLDLFQRIIKQQLSLRMTMGLYSFAQMPGMSTGSVHEAYMDI